MIVTVSRNITSMIFTNMNHDIRYQFQYAVGMIDTMIVTVSRNITCMAKKLSL